ncbi:unnamed protein product, partial [Allacma fusca]
GLKFQEACLRNENNIRISEFDLLARDTQISRDNGIF